MTPKAIDLKPFNAKIDAVPLTNANKLKAQMQLLKEGRGDCQKLYGMLRDEQCRPDQMLELCRNMCSIPASILVERLLAEQQFDNVPLLIEAVCSCPLMHSLP